MSLRRLLYSALFYLILPLIILRLLIRSRKNPAYRQRLLERFGFVSDQIKPDVKRIWLHAVSVGESIAAKPLIAELLVHYPDHQLLVTTTTPTGSATVKQLFGGQVEHIYFPYDLPDVIRRFLSRVQPEKLIIMETEIWPNLFAACEKKQIPVMIANARLSARSTKGYAKIQNLIAETLQRVNLIAVRSEQDAEHFKQLGANAGQLEVAGNIKFALSVPDDVKGTGEQLRAQWGKGRLVWVAASTHQGEDEKILAIYQRMKVYISDLLLIIVPRHPERFDAVASLAQASGNVVQRRSSGENFTPATAIIIGDSMGEMLKWYAAADLVFMGGSLVETGGHNPLEPAALGVPVVSGSQVFNFADIFPLLVEHEAAWVCETESGLQNIVLELLQNTEKRQQAGANAQQVFTRQQGVVARLMDFIARL